MAFDSKVIIKILGDATNFDKAINGAEASLNGLKSVLAKLGLGASLGAVAKEVVTNTNALEDAMSTASTLFGDVDVDIDNFRKKILELSSETGQSATSITNSLYNAFSSGVEVTEDMSTAMEFMETASKLAVAGLTDVDSAVDVLSKTMNAYGMSTDEVDQIAKNLVQTQNMGIVTVGELSQFLANVTPTASAYGVSLEDIGASISVMTKAGTNASSATTNLNRVLLELVDNESETAKNLKKATKEVLGQEKSFSDLQDESYNLQQVLLVMQQYAESAGLSIADLFSSSNAKSGAIQIAKDVQTYTDYIDAMESETDIVQESYDKMMDTRSKAWSQLANRLKNITINIGLGTGSQTLMDKVYDLADSVVTKFEEWTPAINRGLNILTVGGALVFNYLKENIDKLPTYIITAFTGAKIFSSIKSALGLSDLTTGAIGWAVALEIKDALDGTKSWEQVGKDCIKALAVGLGVGALFGTQAGGLAFALTMTIDPDFSDLAEKVGEEINRLLSGDETEAINPVDEVEAETAVDAIGDYLGIVARRWFITIGDMFNNMVNGQWLKALTSFTDNAKLLGAETMDFFLSFFKGKGYSEWTDQVRLEIARRDTPSASQFGDGDLLRYLNDAEAQGIDFEEYLQQIIAKQAEIAPIDLTSVDVTTKVENVIEKPNIIQQTVAEVTAEGIEIGTEEGAKRAEEILKEKLEASGSPLAQAFAEMVNINWDTIQTNVDKGIDPEHFRTSGTEAGTALGEGMEEGTKEALEIHSPSKTYEEIGEYIVEGLEKGMTESALEQLKATLDTTYTEMGQDIMTWLSEGMKDGQTYTIMDAIKDFLQITNEYSDLGKQVDGIEIKEDGIADLDTIGHRTTGGGGINSVEGWILDENGKWVKQTKSAWQSMLDWLKNACSDTGNWLFNDIGKIGEDGTIEEFGKTGLDCITSIYDQLSSLSSYWNEVLSNDLDSQISAMEEARDNAKKYNELTIEEEKEYDAKIKALKKEQFEKEKRANIATAVMDGALAIMNIIKEWSGNVAMQATLSAIAGATTVAQIASISSQQSGYEHGGLIGGHGYTGDKQQIWANAGELILNRTQQRAIADQLSYGGNTTVIQVEFSGNVFGDQQTVAEYVYDAIKTAQAQGALRAW